MLVIRSSSFAAPGEPWHTVMLNGNNCLQKTTRTMAKAFIWLVTLIGLAPAIVIGCVCCSIMRASARMGPYGPIDVPSSDINANYVHDSYFSVGSWTVYVTPQYWSVVAMFLGCFWSFAAYLGLCERHREGHGVVKASRQYALNSGRRIDYRSRSSTRLASSMIIR